MNKRITIAAATLTTVATVGLAGGSVSAESMTMQGQNMQEGPAHIVENGSYSDVRFIDATIPHHMMAIQMAQVEVGKGDIEELRDMARMMIDEQKQEIAELKRIRYGLTGSAEAPMMMNQHMMENSGMPTPEELAASDNVDLAFIDAMVPHHSQLNPMANTVLVNSDNEELKEMARKLINSQSEQIGEMISIREDHFPGVVEPPYTD